MKNMFFGEASKICVKKTATQKQIELLKKAYPNAEIVIEEESNKDVSKND